MSGESRDSDLPPGWPPPWHALLAGVFFILAIDAVAFGRWAVAPVTLLLAAIAALWDRVVRRR